MKLTIGISGAALAVMLTACGGEQLYKPERFSAKPTLEITEALSADSLQGREVGTAGNAKARAMIVARFEELGLLKDGPSYEHPFKYGAFADPESGQDTTPNKTGINLIAYLPGTEGPERSMVVTAHYDHIGIIDGEIHNGADDNASGVAALLAVAEYFSKNPPKHDVAFIAFDAEEDGFGGARAFITEPPVPLDIISFNLNLDMIARGDNELLWASGTHHWPEMKPIVEAVAADAPVTLKMGFDEGDGREDWTLLSDHMVFFRAGIPHLYLGVEDHVDYHEPSDDFDKIDQDWFLRSVETVVMMAATADQNLEAIHAMKAGE